MSKTLILLICIFALWFVIGATNKITDNKNKKDFNISDDVKRTRANAGVIINEVKL